MKTPAGFAPIIVTARVDPASQAMLDVLRQRHFPVDRNHLAAHLTMYHCLPGNALEALREHLGMLARRQPVAVRLSVLRSLGHGVAVNVDSDELTALRDAVGAPFQRHLTAQDRQRWRPHVTIANKLAADQADALLTLLSAGWQPRSARVEGIGVWRYLRPHWQWLATVPLEPV